MRTPRTETFTANYAPLTVESCLEWARQLEREYAELRAALSEIAALPPEIIRTEEHRDPGVIARAALR